MRNIVEMERRLLAEALTPELIWEAKRLGFSDEQVGTLADGIPEQMRRTRQDWGIRPVYKMVDTCAAEFEASTPYFYSSYDKENEAEPLKGRKAVVIGSGPIRIGQGIEFDYCSVHSAWALQEAGYASIWWLDRNSTDLTWQPSAGRGCSEPGGHPGENFVSSACLVGSGADTPPRPSQPGDRLPSTQ
jgi:hypothetical protein